MRVLKLENPVPKIMRNIQVVLVRPRFPENIGMAARACANMGAGALCLVEPELWANTPKQREDPVFENAAQQGVIPERYETVAAPLLNAPPTSPYRERALALATNAGKTFIDNIQEAPSLSAAIASTTLCLGTTARTGGWRQHILNPEQAAQLCAKHILQGGSVSLVFGPEDTGLLNSDIELCTHLVCIPTALEAASLNLAQAVLILLYELRKAFLACKQNATDEPISPSSQIEAVNTSNLFVPTLEKHETQLRQRGRVRHSPLISLAQKELLTATLKETMQAIDYLPLENSSYLMLPISRLIGRASIRHNEFSMLMGICRKTLRLARKQRSKEI